MSSVYMSIDTPWLILQLYYLCLMYIVYVYVYWYTLADIVIILSLCDVYCVYVYWYTLSEIVILLSLCDVSVYMSIDTPCLIL